MCACRRTRPMSLAEAQRIAGFTPTPTPAARPVVVGRKPAAATRTAAFGEGIQWISESRANSGNLPPGRYRYRDSGGRIHGIDRGHAACMESLRERRLERASKTLGYSDSEERTGVAMRTAGRFQVMK